MITLKFSEFLEGDYDDHDEDHFLYILKGEGCTLYVGISKAGIWNRWFGSPSSHIYWVNDEMCHNSRAGEAVVVCLPGSMDWTMELWTVEDCIVFLKREYKGEFYEKRCYRQITYAEDLLIKIMKPVLNIAGAKFSPDNLPEKLKQHEAKKGKALDYLYNKIFNQ